MSLQQEEQIHQSIRDVYNSGNCAKAVEMSIQFLKDFPKSYRARYAYAVMHGDYSVTPGLSAEEKKRLWDIARNGVRELFNDPELTTWPERFQRSVKNEYYWFFEEHENQYNMGVEEVKVGSTGGHYSACVGASMMALKQVKSKNIPVAEEWATKSLFHFHEYEKISPDWYNINYFSAQSLACLGRYDKALESFKGMYRKQKAPENAKEIEEFLVHLKEIRGCRDE